MLWEGCGVGGWMGECVRWAVCMVYVCWGEAYKVLC